MLLRVTVSALALAVCTLGTIEEASAQSYSNSWARRSAGPYMMRPDNGYRSPGYRRYVDRYEDDDEDDYRPRKRSNKKNWDDDEEDEDDEPTFQPKKKRQQASDNDGGDEVRSGGPRPAISAKSPSRVKISTKYSAGSVVIDQSARQLYYIISDREAYRYPISVGRIGFSWTGSEKVSRIADWPDWHPPEEMRERDPSLPVKMTGGINNPLGAKAIYLGNTLYRIHGTNNPGSIGQAASSGCFRMMNAHVTHLAGLVGVGTQVHVLKHMNKAIASAN
jgi:lipoprotein-anchoring transpeptidase ErfK/SrfK